MSKLNRQQTAAVAEFITVTACDLPEKKAIEILKSTGWDVDRATEYFFDHGGADAFAPKPAKRIDATALDAVFARFKDPAGDAMGMEGIQAYCEALRISPVEMQILFIAYSIGAANMGEFTRAEFVNGWTKLGCDTLEKMVAKIPTLVQKCTVKAEFEKFYVWVFKFAKGPSKTLKIEMALPLWGLVLQDRFTLLPQWLAFMESRSHAISADSWTLLLQFADQTQGGIPDSFDAEGAWPSLIDDFVAEVRRR
eukprot:c33178_g1_i1.p2 GENE.c33178_g1_i1~~c33178_g1_i1.p2  ORF type:complete len:252 (+),score=54.28 c33178_g1_i1:68-823(+)